MRGFRTRAIQHLLSGAGAIAALTLLPSQAAAQEQTAQATGETEGVEEIVVRARLRSEDIQDIPVAVTAISPARLDNLAAPNVQDLEGITPNLVIDSTNVAPGAASIAIRGISFEDVEKSFDPAVGVLVDGVYLGTNTGALLDFFDFESVEVLRGPQGTLFGRNTTGGVINVRRTRPTLDWGVRGEVTLGRFGREEYRVVANAPLIPGKLGVKGFFFDSTLDGFLRNVTRNERAGRLGTRNYGVTVRAEPAPRFDAQITIEHYENTGQATVGQLSDGGDLICNPFVRPFGGAPANECNRTAAGLYTVFSNKLDRNILSGDAITGEINIGIGEFTLTSVTGYRDSDERVTWDTDGSSVNFFDVQRNQVYRQFSQELRIAGNITDRINVVAGLYYFRNRYVLFQTTNFGPLLQTLAQLPAQSFQVARYNSESYAAFIDADINLTDALRLSVGGRYTVDDKRLRNAFLGSFSSDASRDFKKFTPRVSLDYKFNEDVLTYASFSRGFRSGGFNGRAQSLLGSTVPYEPEEVDSYEVGLKTTLFDRKLTFNLAAFYTDYKNKQEEAVVATPPGSPNPQETLVTNAASATIKGIEAEFQARPTRSLTLRGTLGYLDAEYDSFPSRQPNGTPIDLSTLTLRRAPDITASVGGDYTLETGIGRFTLSTEFRYIDPYETTINPVRGPGGVVVLPARNDPRGTTDAQNLLDASLTWVGDVGGAKLRATVFGRNLLDDRGLNSALPVAQLFTFGIARPPRTYGVTLGFEF